ncbi:MAG TPA: hypothetical protein DEF07_06160 [Nitrosomonas sp.]|nr:hypothetical protein [Nitrosomonas sp.]HNP52656.1 hypothetical protein [Nitrosomonas nitrosa]
MTAGKFNSIFESINIANNAKLPVFSYHKTATLLNLIKKILADNSKYAEVQDQIKAGQIV